MANVIAYQYKHAFDFYYKWCPTGSGQLTNISWSQHYNTGSGNVYVSASWYDLNVLSYGISTRHTSSITTKDGALPWASPAADMLWNVLTPSASVSQSIDGAGDYQTVYRFTYNSRSFYYNEFLPSGLTAGLTEYPITSSWIAYEPRMIAYASGATSTGYKVTGTGLAYFPATIGAALPYSLPSNSPLPILPTTTYPNVGHNPSTITYTTKSTGSNDGRFFDLAGGCGITRASISSSLVAFNASSSVNTEAARVFCAAQLKKRRLFFPTIQTGSAAPNSPSTWVSIATGKNANQFFTENGGIYNVKFSLKRDTTNNYYPDGGENSQLLVYIHNINTTTPAPTDRVPGASGWYPPENNIIRIKNNPAMSFYNPATGYLIESFNINVIQYGTPAQLVFEASGSLTDNTYFGCIIDDVEFCKIGVTTDPNLIKPTTPAQGIAEAQQQRQDF